MGIVGRLRLELRWLREAVDEPDGPFHDPLFVLCVLVPALLLVCLLAFLALWGSRLEPCRPIRQPEGAPPQRGRSYAMEANMSHVTINYLRERCDVRCAVQVADDHPLHSRALWLSEPSPNGPVVDCTVSDVPPDAVVGDCQEREPYLSPRYARDPSPAQLVDDEERRRRFVEQARRVAAYLREHMPGQTAGFRRLAVLAVVALVVGCASPVPVHPVGEAECRAAARAFDAGAALLAAGEEPPVRGYLFHFGRAVLWTPPTSGPLDSPPPGAIAIYDVETRQIVPLRSGQ